MGNLNEIWGIHGDSAKHNPTRQWNFHLYIYISFILGAQYFTKSNGRWKKPQNMVVHGGFAYHWMKAVKIGNLTHANWKCVHTSTNTHTHTHT